MYRDMGAACDMRAPQGGRQIADTSRFGRFWVFLARLQTPRMRRVHVYDMWHQGLWEVGEGRR